MLLFGCYSEGDIKSKTMHVSEKTSKSRVSPSTDTIVGLPLPVGSQTSIDGNNINIQLPTGYRFGGIDYEGNIHMISSGSSTVTCNCITPSTGSCAPFETSSQVGCASEKDKICNNCEMTVSSGLVVFREYYIFTPTSFMPGFADDVLIINNLHLWDQLPWANEELIDNNEQLLSEIFDFAYDGYVEGDLLVSIPVAIDSSRFLMEVPYGSVEENMMYTINLSDAAGETTARCSGCDGDCKFASYRLGQIRTCINCNSGCTLSF
ncbi:MAG: hypothetical protein EA362_00340 [Saprospirales bacterium]|nr:MAG: hypothetical protein EA362_00340 [Saprospirales bacterium]